MNISQAESLVHILRIQAAAYGEKTAFQYLEDGETPGYAISFAGLATRAQAIAASIREHCRPGERALMLYPPGVDFIEGFFGCLAAGVVAVPAYLPEPQHLERHLPRLYAIAAGAQPSLVLGDSRQHAFLAPLLQADERTCSLPYLATDRIQAAALANDLDTEVKGETLAAMIYTSGSTSDPKGALITHHNFLHNVRLVTDKFRNDPEATYVSWLPLHHDLGLIVVMLGALYCGASCYLMAPADFIARPLRWLEAISRYRARNAGGPNFAFELCVRKTNPDQRRSLDLSSWRVAFNGAEPVRADTLARFADAFAPCGFRPESAYPAYGMAEATGMISGGTPGILPSIRAFDEAAMGQGRVVEVPAGQPGSRVLISCGSTGLGQEIAIVDPDTGRRCAADEIGEIWLRGDSIGPGYWRRPDISEQTYAARIEGGTDARFLRTGDLGFLVDGEVYLAGRHKDLIIIRGVNYHPQDIEHVAEQSHPALRPGCSAAFPLEIDGEEVVGIVAEAEPQARGEEVIAAIRTAVARRFELPLYRVALIAPRISLKTSSGKIRRRATRASLVAGELPVWAEDSYLADRAPAGPEPQASTSNLFDDLVQDVLGSPAGESALAQELRQLPQDERRSVLAREIEAVLRDVLRLDARFALAGDQRLDELGVDSIRAVDVAEALSAKFSLSLSEYVALTYRTLDTLVDHLDGEVMGPGQGPDSE